MRMDDIIFRKRIDLFLTKISTIHPINKVLIDYEINNFCNKNNIQQDNIKHYINQYSEKNSIYKDKSTIFYVAQDNKYLQSLDDDELYHYYYYSEAELPIEQG